MTSRLKYFCCRIDDGGRCRCGRGVQLDFQMTVGYVFTSDKKMAITERTDGSNLPAPKRKSEPWKLLMRVNDARHCGIAGFDLKTFQQHGYQLLSPN